MAFFVTAAACRCSAFLERQLEGSIDLRDMICTPVSQRQRELSAEEENSAEEATSGESHATRPRAVH